MRPDEYVTVMPAIPRTGWMVGARNGDIITHTRIDAPIYDRELAREQAQAMFPDRYVYVRDDEVKPWQR